MPPVVNIGVSSTGDHTISNFPSRLNGQREAHSLAQIQYSVPAQT
jgi:hypothetical protein